eukprot:3180330-Rhodomonas_salina.2
MPRLLRLLSLNFAVVPPPSRMPQSEYWPSIVIVKGLKELPRIVVTPGATASQVPMLSSPHPTRTDPSGHDGQSVQTVSFHGWHLSKSYWLPFWSAPPQILHDWQTSDAFPTSGLKVRNPTSRPTLSHSRQAPADPSVQPKRIVRATELHTVEAVSADSAELERSPSRGRSVVFVVELAQQGGVRRPACDMTVRSANVADNAVVLEAEEAPVEVNRAARQCKIRCILRDAVNLSGCHLWRHVREGVTHRGWGRRCNGHNGCAWPSAQTLCRSGHDTGLRDPLGSGCCSPTQPNC